jgi:hypothetical protein
MSSPWVGSDSSGMHAMILVAEKLIFLRNFLNFDINQSQSKNKSSARPGTGAGAGPQLRARIPSHGPRNLKRDCDIYHSVGELNAGTMS